MELIGDAFEVPANASRFLGTRDEALQQPRASVQLAWCPEDPWLHNASFDPTLIAYDSSYCTSVVDLDEVAQVPTMTYFADRVLAKVHGEARVVDIGCGQGEFVTALRGCGVDAIGYDPVLRSPQEHLHREYWVPGRDHADVFVMRCVLPHIPEPWTFLHLLGHHHGDALVLIEYQRLEWILHHEIWYQVSHDHVNLFSADDFTARFDVLDQGSFAQGEWGWVLIRASSGRTPEPAPCALAPALTGLLRARCDSVRSAARAAGPFVLWGAAGKGIVLAHALLEGGARVTAAIDADPLRQGRYTEVSGLRIMAPSEAASLLPDGTTVLVCNPNHLDAVRRRVGEAWRILLPSDLRELIE